MKRERSRSRSSAWTWTESVNGARDLHRVQQPAELGRVRQRRDVERLLEVAVDAQVALVGPVDPGRRDELAQRVRGLGGVARVSDGVELADDLEPLPRGRRGGGPACGRRWSG